MKGFKAVIQGKKSCPILAKPQFPKFVLVSPTTNFFWEGGWNSFRVGEARRKRSAYIIGFKCDSLLLNANPLLRVAEVEDFT